MNNYNILSQKTFEKIEKTQKRFINSKKRVQNLVDYALKLKFSEHSHLTTDILNTISDCGSWLEFRNYYNFDVTKLHNANFCKKDKLCPACAMRRASKQVKKVYDLISTKENLKNKNWYYIVLPVQHNSSEDYETVFNRARDGLKTLRKAINNSKKFKNSSSFFSQFDGLFYSFEVTKNDNGWNVHINLMCCSDNPIDGIYLYKHEDGKVTYQHKDIMRDWSKYTDNNSFMHSINKIDTSSKESIIKNLLEIFKYALKFQELENEDLLEVYEKTYRKRLIGAFGSLYGIKLDVDFEDKEILDSEFLEIIYQFDYSSNSYMLHSQTFKKEDPIEKLPPKKKLPNYNIFKKPNSVKITVCHNNSILNNYSFHKILHNNLTNKEITAMQFRTMQRTFSMSPPG